MNGKKLKLSLLCVVLLFFGSSVVAFGDWDPGDPYKMHFPQLPDPFGWDIAFCREGPPEQRLELADDWQCTRTGPVSDIHFWISWEGDGVGAIESVMVCIYSNDPYGPSGWSEPNELLWSRYFPDGTSTITIRPYGTGEQGWYDPNTGFWNSPDHYNYYQINITDINEPFIQQEGEIYWLGIHIKAVPFPDCRVGWKTAIQPPHFMDDAVWRVLTGGPWMELRDPMTYESLDLSFVITSKEEPNYAKPLEPHTKWSQPPIEIDPCSTVPTYCGWDEKSYNRDTETPAEPWKIVADDFRCLGSMPVTSIHWWGSYFDWECTWAQGLPPIVPKAWWIGFWSNMPAGMQAPYSYPNMLLHEFTVPANRVVIDEVGCDQYYGYYPYDITFQYYLDLDEAEVFWQDDYNDMTYDDTYWISIVALYDLENPPTQYQWGWKTRPWPWMDDAVKFNLPSKPVPGQTNDPLSITPIVDPRWGESMDVSFELDTDPNYIKWEQLYTGIRNWPHYEDELSMTSSEPNIIRLVADDWRCVRRTPVTAVVWWGSYIGYGFEACSQGPFMPLPVPPDRFRLMMWTDVAADPCDPCSYSHPGEVIWRYDTDKYDEVLVGYDKKHPQGIDVAICGAPSIPAWNNDVQAKLLATGQFNTVDIINVTYITPTLAQLQAYDAVLVYSDAIYADTNALGNVMADYVDSGGGVVCMMFEIGMGGGQPNPFCQMQGRWDAQGYYVIPRTQQFGPPQATLGTVYDPTHPIMQGVSSFDGGTFSARPIPTTPIPPGVTRIADWSDGSLLVVTKLIGSVRRADLGFFPPSSDARTDFWVSSTDGALLMANALAWVASGSTSSNGPHEPVFRYSVRLPEEKWFHQPDYNEVFWLSVQAIYDINMPNYDWGWTNHKHVFNDDAVRYYFNPDILQWVWDELYDQTGESEDMSFMLFTDPNVCSTCADYNCDARVNFLDYADFADAWLWTGSAGGYNNSDLNCDGSVDFYDLKIFVDQWLSSCP